MADPHTFSAILVQADRTDGAEARAALAADLADRFGGKLIGAAAAQPYIPVYAPFGESFIALQPEVLQTAREQGERDLSAAEARFRAGAGGHEATWRQSLTTDCAGFMADLTRGADLVVVGRPGASDKDTALGLYASDLVMTAGRPVLVTPPGVTRLSAARMVMGWKDTREARRAALDALPFFKRAEEVFIVTAGADADETGAAEVAAWLTGHGVTARAVNEKSTEANVADTILAVAARVNADLVVAGAFGHSRMREWAFGGVTRALLTRAPCAVLFSH